MQPNSVIHHPNFWIERKIMAICILATSINLNSSVTWPCSHCPYKAKFIRLPVIGQCQVQLTGKCVYNGHVFYTLLYEHDNLIHLFYNSTFRVMNSRASGQCLYTILVLTIITNTTCSYNCILGITRVGLSVRLVTVRWISLYF